MLQVKVGKKEESKVEGHEGTVETMEESVWSQALPTCGLEGEAHLSYRGIK